MLYQRILISCFVIVSVLLTGCVGMGHSGNDRESEDTQTAQTVTHEDEINEIIIIQDDTSEDVDPECNCEPPTTKVTGF